MEHMSEGEAKKAMQKEEIAKRSFIGGCEEESYTRKVEKEGM